jgi:hypothetical protein
MYHLIVTHNWLRYVLLILIVLSIMLALEGIIRNKKYSKTDRILSGAVSGLSHVQLIIGFFLYFQSPTAQYFWVNRSLEWSDSLFFGIVHLTMMSTAIIFITIGAALAKRANTDVEKFRLVFKYFSIALFLIFIAIPWPFSPLAQRPYIRPF